MVGNLLIYLASVILIGWGTAHLFPTGNIIKGFGDISTDNKRIIAMEWIIEGVALIFIGAVVGLVTYIDSANTVSTGVYILSFIFLNILSVVSLMTGFRINFLPFRLCPVIFTGSSILILAGMYL